MSYRSLFSSSYLGLIHILLDQTRYDEMRILGCEALYDFVTNQVHNSCQFYLFYSTQNQILEPQSLIMSVTVFFFPDRGYLYV